MRLFIAIDFSAENKALLHHIASNLKSQLSRGNLGKEANFHLTLAFLGECESAASAISSMEQTAQICHPFTLKTCGAGRFRRPGGDICWLGAEKEPELLICQKMLMNKLRQQGFNLEERSFQPHLTLLREAAVPGDFNWTGFSRQLKPIIQQVEYLTLMQSSRIKGRLVYTPLHQSPLTGK